MGKSGHFAGSGGITVIKENNIAVGGNMQHHMIQGSSHQPTNMMGRRLADQGHQGGVTGGSNQHFGNNQGPVGDNPIIGISAGMVRLKGNSPKVSGKDGQNRPRTIKQFGAQNSQMSAGVGGVGSIGQVGSGSLQNSQFGVRTIQS